MLLKQGRKEGGEIFFLNEKSGGTQLFRPLAKTATKETDEMIVATIKRIEAEIANLEETILIYGEQKKKIRVRHMVMLTMLDGKSRYRSVSIIIIFFLLSGRHTLRIFLHKKYKMVQ